MPLWLSLWFTNLTNSTAERKTICLKNKSKYRKILSNPELYMKYDIPHSQLYEYTQLKYTFSLFHYTIFNKQKKKQSLIIFM